MKKKLPLILIILLIIAQLSVPAAMISYSKTIDQKIFAKGTKHLISIILYSVNENDVHFRFDTDLYYTEKNYADFKKATNVDTVNTIYKRRPKDTDDYINTKRFSEMKTYQLDEPVKRDIYLLNYSDNQVDAYAEIYVYKGKYFLKEIFVNDMPINEWLKDADLNDFTMPKSSWQ